MKKIYIIIAVVGLHMACYACTPQSLSDDGQVAQDCCGDDGTIPPPPPPPKTGNGG